MPTFKPTNRPTNEIEIPADMNPVYMEVPRCYPFNVSNTNSATTNTNDCNLFVCPGTILSFRTCLSDGKTCAGDTFLRLFQGGTELANNDDGCGFCSELTYEFQGSTCDTYSLHQGCFGDSQCSGQTWIVEAEQSESGDGPLSTGMDNQNFIHAFADKSKTSNTAKSSSMSTKTSKSSFYEKFTKIFSS
jgi:hypothetical protein